MTTAPTMSRDAKHVELVYAAVSTTPRDLRIVTFDTVLLSHETSHCNRCGCCHTATELRHWPLQM